MKRSMDDGEKRFNQLSIEERGKFDEETLVNVNSIKRNNAGSQRSSGFSNEYIVVCSQMAPGLLYHSTVCDLSSIISLFILTFFANFAETLHDAYCHS